MDLTLLIKAALMGIVEGLTEFLPISSTGHLILAGTLLGFHDEKAKVFDIAIQTGAILAVILVYWQKIRDTVVALPSERQAQRFALNVLIAFFPAVVLGLLAGKAIKAHLFTAEVVATTFIIGGFIILWAEKLFHLEFGDTERCFGAAHMFDAFLEQRQGSFHIEVGGLDGSYDLFEAFQPLL